MRHIGRLDDFAAARRFSDVLYARGIANDVRPDGKGGAVWVHDDARVAEAKDALEVFQVRAGGGFDAEAVEGQARRREIERKDAAYRARLVHARASIHGVHGHGYVTMTVGTLAIVIAVVTRLGSDFSHTSWLFLTLYPPDAHLPEVRDGQVWRLLTPILIHFGILHLLFNLSAWSTFARAVEVRKGAVFMLLFTVVTGLVSNAAEFGWHLLRHPYERVAFGGLSGVIYGLFGYFYVKGRIDPLDRLELDEGTTRLGLIWLVLGFTGALGPIANGAHVAGLAWGIAHAFLDVAWFRWRKRRR